MRRTWSARSLFAVLGLTAAATLAIVPAALANAEDTFTVHHDAKTQRVLDVAVSPDGTTTAFTVSVPRDPYEGENGPAYRELHVAGPEPGRTRAFVAGEVRVSDIAWTPDGRGISFLAKRHGDESTALYVIPVDGGEAKKILEHEEALREYSWSPDGRRVAFLARDEKPEHHEKLADKGFKAKIYEEQLRFVRVFVATIGENGMAEGDPKQLEIAGSASELHWAPEGDRLAVALAPTPLIDDHYMKRQIHVVSANDGDVLGRIDNPGKMARVRWSPNGERIAFLSGEDIHDPGDGRLMIADSSGGTPAQVLPDLEGDVVAFEFADDDTLVYVGHRSVETFLGEVGVDGDDDRVLVPEGGPAIYDVDLASSGRAALLADTPRHPREVYAWSSGDDTIERVSNVNPWLDDLRLAKQEIVRYDARDGQWIEGLLIHPLERTNDERVPLIVVVHGGPEAHYSNGWITRYANPGQYGAAKGFAVFYPNYRGSTGRGPAFAKEHQRDYAGKEFDDLVDGVKHLVERGLVDEDRVGIMGGSYGGFAAAWGATALSEHFAASVMFVGISDQVSKFGTTDIPNEMYLVHARVWPWEDWEFFQERSPVYHVEKARTPILIVHGEQDTRVDPSQSLQMYRYLRTYGKAPVRLVLYPEEGHGNAKAAARLDYAMRMLRWMEHYLMGEGGDPPPVDLEHEDDELNP
jgi:dipeptidyl aminopeptidase/acylaminoacyl peptidase